ncbi:hypothetical protein ABE438_14700 [Bosea sp. TWI1241]|uniref:hypothetical protein n=1 Tax=Bosea sp. TWI1241 TaxID=3148904 RepID=UPI00320AECF8
MTENAAATNAAGQPAVPADALAEKGVIAKLRAARDGQTGMDSLTLKSCGVEVTYPRFRSFKAWEQAQRQAGEVASSVNLYYIVQVCLFDGERLRAEEYRELISDTDHMAISSRIFSPADAGNG